MRFFHARILLRERKGTLLDCLTSFCLFSYIEKQSEVSETKNNLEMLRWYENCPKVAKEYKIDGNKITVVRHFVESKELGELMQEIAERKAKRDFGLV